MPSGIFTPEAIARSEESSRREVAARADSLPRRTKPIPAHITCNFPTPHVMPNPAITPQHIKFSDATGGGVIHKVTLPEYTGWFSLWYDRAGVLLDAEAMDTKNRPRTIRPGTPCWTALTRKLRTFLTK